MVLISLLQAPQDGDGLRRSRLIHHDHLETSFQCLVGLEIFLIFVQCCGTDRPQLAPGQCRFKNIGRIHCTGSPSGTDQRMNLIYEQDNLSLAVHNVLYDAFQPLLELALILGTCYKCTHIKRIDDFIFQVFRDSPINNLLRKTFGDSGFTHTRFTYENRVVLGPTAQYLQHSTDLLIPADDRVKFPRCSSFVQVHRELVQCLKLSAAGIVLHVVIFHNNKLLFVPWSLSFRSTC